MKIWDNPEDAVYDDQVGPAMGTKPNMAWLGWELLEKQLNIKGAYPFPAGLEDPKPSKNNFANCSPICLAVSGPLSEYHL